MTIFFTFFLVPHDTAWNSVKRDGTIRCFGAFVDTIRNVIIFSGPTNGGHIMRKVTAKTKRIAKRLSQLSKARTLLQRISQNQQAREMGWSGGTLCQYLLGHQEINYDALFIMCDYYGVSPFDLDPDLWVRVMKHPPCVA